MSADIIRSVKRQQVRTKTLRSTIESASVVLGTVNALELGPRGLSEGIQKSRLKSLPF